VCWGGGLNRVLSFVFEGLITLIKVLEGEVVDRGKLSRDNLLRR